MKQIKQAKYVLRIKTIKVITLSSFSGIYQYLSQIWYMVDIKNRKITQGMDFYTYFHE